ncbi:MAG: ArsB/NhaD family transporter [Deltaproteobacteria bacterium]|nr:ArsB/NhaD family transporter [Deltaproteobacteria bacterium]
MKAILAILIFVIAYIFIATEKVNKTVVAIVGAGVAIAMGLVSFDTAIEAVDFNVIFLLVGMMISVHILSSTGFFEWIAVHIARATKGEPLNIMLFLFALTAMLSAFLDNVTTIILIVPVTILISQLLEIQPHVFMISEVIASNIGGTATLIGDPPNIVIGSQANLTFMDFLTNLAPGIGIVLIFFLLTVGLILKKRLNVPQHLKDRLTLAEPALAIVDLKTMRRSLAIFAVMFVGFFVHGLLHIEPGVIALFFSMVMLLVCKSDGDEVMKSAEWGVILFFVGMFMLVAALEVNGVIAQIGNYLVNVMGNNLFGTCMAIMWGSAIFSAILDNIPFVIAMVPLVKTVIAHFAALHGAGDVAFVDAEIAQPIWWSLALGACLGGNGTLIGASANVVMARIAERNNCPVSFKRFFKWGFAFTIQALLISTAYIWLRYF